MAGHSTRCKKHSFIPKSLAEWCSLSAPHLQLIRSNNLLTASQLRMVEKKTVIAEKELACLEHEIDRLRRLRYFMETVIEAHKTVSAPIRRLPQETLSQVFSFCICGHSDGDETQRIRSEPWRVLSELSQVCKNWRDAITSSPSLWNNIIITCTDYNIPSADPISRHLRYSGDLPLTVQINGGSHSQGLEREVQVWELLFSARRRLKSLAFKTTEDLISFIGSEYNSDMTHLEVLSATCWFPPTIALEAFSTAPLLNDLSLQVDRIYSAEEFGLATFQWTQLTQLSLNYISPDIFIPILAATPNLIVGKFVVHRHRDDLPPTTSQRTVRLPLLSSLDLQINHAGDTQILDSLIAPSLEEITFSTPRTILYQVPNLESIIDLLRRSSCAIKQASLTVNSESVGRLVELLAIMPTLLKLAITYFTKDDDDDTFGLNPFFASLTFCSEVPEETSLPHVENIMLSHHSASRFYMFVSSYRPRQYPPFQFQTLRDMLRSRYLAPSNPDTRDITVPLITIDPKWVRQVKLDNEDRALLTELKGLGIKVEPTALYHYH